MSDSQTTSWNRECVICAHKWLGDETDDCPICVPTQMTKRDLVSTDNDFRSRAHYLEHAKTDAHEAWIAVQAGDWLRADIFLKLAIDEIADAGVLP